MPTINRPVVSTLPLRNREYEGFDPNPRGDHYDTVQTGPGSSNILPSIKKMTRKLRDFISTGLISLVLCCVTGCVSSCNGQSEFGKNYLTLEKVIPMPDVSGRIDHLAANESLQMIYVAALGNNTVEIADLKSGKVIRTIRGLHEPQGVEYLSLTNSIFVSNGEGGSCNFFDAATFKQMSSLDYKDDADDVRYSRGHKKVYVGYGEGGIGVINEEMKSEIGRITFEGHPEGFQVDPKTNKIWVNVPDTHKILVLDGQHLKVIDQWKFDDLSANFPMAYDSIHHRLFIGFRSPSKLIVLDSETGRRIASLPCTGDTDDLFYDADTKRIIVSGGIGYIDIFSQDNEGNYSATAHIATRKGARTSLWIPSTRQLVLAVPHRNGQQAELRVYKMIH